MPSSPRLVLADAKVQAPCDANRFYEEWQKRLNSIIGLTGSPKHEGDRRETVWKTSTGGPAGRGEIIILESVPKQPYVHLMFDDGDLAKPK